MGSPCSLMTVFRLTYHYGDLAVPLPISPDACSNIRYKADRKNSFAPQERPSLDISMEKFIPAACVYREDHVCLIQPLKNSKSTDPDFPNISFFFSPRNCLDIQTDEECLCAGSCRKGIQKERSLPRNGAGDEFEQRNRSKEVMIIRNTGAKSIPTGIRALMFWEWYEFTGGIISTLAHLHLSAKDII